jgi:hypothetical protein
VVAIVIGALRRRPRAFGAWLLFALAQGLFVAGDAYLTIAEAVWHTEPFPSPADALYVAGYPTFAVGLLLLIRARTPGRDWAALIDAAIVTTGVAAVAWVFVMEPYTRDTTLPLLSKLVSISNPIGSLLLLAVASRLLLGTRARTPVFYAITAALLLQLGGDAVYAVQSLAGTYVDGSLVDVTWLGSYVLWGAAALHQSMRQVSSVRMTYRRVSVSGASPSLQRRACSRRG